MSFTESSLLQSFRRWLPHLVFSCAVFQVVSSYKRVCCYALLKKLLLWLSSTEIFNSDNQFLEIEFIVFMFFGWVHRMSGLFAGFSRNVQGGRRAFCTQWIHSFWMQTAATTSLMMIQDPRCFHQQQYHWITPPTQLWLLMMETLQTVKHVQQLMRMASHAAIPTAMMMMSFIKLQLTWTTRKTLPLPPLHGLWSHQNWVGWTYLNLGPQLACWVWTQFIIIIKVVEEEKLWARQAWSSFVLTMSSVWIPVLWRVIMWVSCHAWILLPSKHFKCMQIW